MDWMGNILAPVATFEKKKRGVEPNMSGCGNAATIDGLFAWRLLPRKDEAVLDKCCSYNYLRMPSGGGFLEKLLVDI